MQIERGIGKEKSNKGAGSEVILSLLDNLGHYTGHYGYTNMSQLISSQCKVS